MKKSQTEFEQEFGLVALTVDVDKLIPYARNSRTHSDTQIAEIAASIKEFGFVNPIIIDDDYNVKAGHGRLLAARKLGMKRVPCLKGSMTETQWKAYVIADNRIAEKATWDWSMLQTEVQELMQADFEIPIIGFEEALFQQVLAQVPTEFVGDAHEERDDHGRESKEQDKGPEETEDEPNPTRPETSAFKQVQLLYTMPEYERFKHACDEAAKELGLTNVTDVVFAKVVGECR